ncbi:MAG: hypothetical protein VX246_07950 [Myxococcota bacterium]|nr:hypothetical protein [Myxococcota bacterium]
MVAFLRHHGISPATPEAALFLLSGIALGVLLGALCLALGRSCLAVVSAALVILSIDAQSDYFAAWNATLFWHFAALALLALLLRRFLARAVPAIALAVLVAASFGASVPDTMRSSREFGAANPSLPLVVHLVLDEYIGIEGIPREFDPDGALEQELMDFYSEWGFALHSRAYSRYFNTHDAIPNLLNFHATREPHAYFEEKFERGASLTANAYFDELRSRGHNLRVYQTDYLDFCGGAGEETVEHCFEYLLETPTRLRDLPLSNNDKFRMLTAMYMRLSVIWRQLRNSYQDLHDTSGGDLPVRGRVSTVSGMLAFGSLREDLSEPEPGAVYFAHLVLPHYPYSYNADCKLRTPASDWLEAGNARTRGAERNTEVSRAERYALYLDQLRCTTLRLGELFEQLRSSGHYESARIIVHGDHGSRITRQKLRFDNEKNTTSRPGYDYIDGFSTLFAIKGPGIAAGTHRAIQPIDLLLDAYLFTGRPPPNQTALQEVLINTATTQHILMPLPNFSHGELIDPESEKTSGKSDN